MANRTNNTAHRWTLAEYAGAYLPLAIVAFLLFGHACCEINAVRFDFPASAKRDRTAVEPASKPADARGDEHPVAPDRPSFSDRVIDEDAVIDAVIDDLMQEDADK